VTELIRRDPREAARIFSKKMSEKADEHTGAAKAFYHLAVSAANFSTTGCCETNANEDSVCELFQGSGNKCETCKEDPECAT
jgi:hypothetical protein